jgi:hypothetical protein
LLQENVFSDSALVVKIFLAKHGVAEISHRPYTPDLASADFFIIKKKTALKGNWFRDVEDIRKNVMAEMNAVPFEALLFSKTF